MATCKTTIPSRLTFFLTFRFSTFYYEPFIEQLKNNLKLKQNGKQYGRFSKFDCAKSGYGSFIDTNEYFQRKSGENSN